MVKTDRKDQKCPSSDFSIAPDGTGKLHRNHLLCNAIYATPPRDRHAPSWYPPITTVNWYACSRSSRVPCRSISVPVPCSLLHSALLCILTIGGNSDTAHQNRTLNDRKRLRFQRCGTPGISVAAGREGIRFMPATTDTHGSRQVHTRRNSASLLPGSPSPCVLRPIENHGLSPYGRFACR